MNRVVLVGRLENSPDLRHTSTGIPVANFSLSVRRSIPNGQGRYERDVFRVVTWRKLAETCCRFLERGRMIAVDGKLQNRIMNSNGGDRRILVEIHADDVRFLEGARPRTDMSQDSADDTDEVSGNPDFSDETDLSYDDDGGFEPESPSEAPAEKDVIVEAKVGSESDGSEGSWLMDDGAGTPLEFGS